MNTQMTTSPNTPRVPGLIEQPVKSVTLVGQPGAPAAESSAADPIEGIVRIHSALRRSLNTIVRVCAEPVAPSDQAAFAEFCRRFARLLHVHHDGEEEIVFPMIAAGAARAALPNYVTHVGHWRADHEKLLGHLRELEVAAARLGEGGPREPLHQAARDLQEMMLPHLAAEEAALHDAAFKNVLTPAELAEMFAASSKHGQKNGGPSVLVLVVHALSDEEQRAHFSEMPWFVRKVLLKRIWDSGFAPCIKYAYNPSIAL
ncbi:MAG TPA: hemerythrin domain-containing protein [Polyangiaceae bacterium]|nr:hemerythrin domain-containing protein [Polyangiaceae bacterium]